MKKQGRVVGTPAPEPVKEVSASPAETVAYEIAGLGARQLEDGRWSMRFLISPFKMVIIVMTDEEKDVLIEQLSQRASGLVTPASTILTP